MNMGIPKIIDRITVKYGALPDQIIDLTAGNGIAASRPLIVLMHGGFWKPLYDRTHMQPLAAALTAAGWSVANIEYRRVPGDPDVTLNDITNAYAALRTTVVPHDGRKLAVGFSAGGHLALWLAATTKDVSLCGAIGMAPVADLALAQELGLGDDAVELFLGTQLSRRATLDPRRLRAPACPVSLLHGEDDAVVPIAVSEFYVAAHPQARLQCVPATTHMALIDPAAAAWPLLVAELQRLAGAQR
jgi:acetyl esterase/lipase